MNTLNKRFEEWLAACHPKVTDAKTRKLMKSAFVAAAIIMSDLGRLK